jgi:uncharacterized protein YceK
MINDKYQKNTFVSGLPLHFCLWITPSVLSLDYPFTFVSGLPLQFCLWITPSVLSLDYPFTFVSGLPLHFCLWITPSLLSLDYPFSFVSGLPLHIPTINMRLSFIQKKEDDFWPFFLPLLELFDTLQNQNDRIQFQTRTRMNMDV